MLEAWWREAAAADPGVVPPGDTNNGAGDKVQAALAALAGSRFLAGATERLLILWLRQVRAYFTEPALREQIQHRFAEAIAPDTEVVVAILLGRWWRMRGCAPIRAGACAHWSHSGRPWLSGP